MPNEIFDSSDANVPAVQATNSGDGGSGIVGAAPTGTGVAGFSTSSIGVDATTESGPAAVRGTHTGDGGAGVLGTGPANGVIGRSTGDGQGFAGVFGEAIDGPGVSGSSTGSVGVDAKTIDGPAALRAIHSGAGGPGVLGISKAVGVWGKSTGDGLGSSGVFGEAIDGPGVSGSSTGSVGVDAKSATGPAALRAIHSGAGGPGVLGISKAVGVWGKSTGDGLGSSGVFGEAIDGPGVSGTSTGSVGMDAKTQTGPAALRAVHLGGGVAGLFGGDVHITQTLRVDVDIEVKGDIRLTNADCAEDFDIAGGYAVDPGTVMVLNDAGGLAASAFPYDKRVAGVVSGAGAYRPGIILDKRETGAMRQPIALLGKVFCKVDAEFQAIAVGDLLTTSPTPGHAMAANDQAKAFGAVIGKALQPLATGRGLIPILIALQ